MGNKKGIITISLVFVFFVAFFISGKIYKNANISAKTNDNKDLKSIYQKSLAKMESDKANINSEKKEYNKFIKDQKYLEVMEKAAKEKEIMEKEAKEAEEKLTAIAATVAVVATKTNPISVQDGSKVAYLTFDDGPSKIVTPRILDTLKQYDIKATFFVTGRMAEDSISLLKRERAEGHVIANHTYSHDYNYLYANTTNLISDFNKCEASLKSIFPDYNSKLVRFPGGSMGQRREAFRQATVNSGYHYVDWNALSNDADSRYIPRGSYCAPVQTLVNSIKETCAGKKHVVILMHDAAAKTTTADALPQVIDYLKSEGYVFKTLD